jgi:thiol-disulfide isomerase/thioredoxin
LRKDGAMRIRWAIAVLAIALLAAMAVNFYMPWRAANAPMQSEGGHGALTCPADAKAAPLDFTMKDVSGKDVTLAEFKGKVILLDFWATWCGPCKVEIPGFVEFQNKYGRRGFQVIGISVDDTAKQLEPYVAELKMNYPVLIGLGHDDVQDAYGPLLGIPTTFLISRDGKICATHAGFTDKETFEHEIKALL